MKRTKALVMRMAVLALLALGVAGCDLLGPDGPKGPGTLTASLVSPNGDEASAVFELTDGVGLGTVSPMGGQVFYEHSQNSSRIVVVMDDPGEVRFQVRTEDVGHLPDVTVIQVGSGENELRSSISGYSVLLTREKDSSKKGRGG